MQHKRAISHYRYVEVRISLVGTSMCVLQHIYTHIYIHTIEQLSTLQTIHRVHTCD